MTTLDEALGKLKDRGSASLVVGTVPPESYVRISRRMLGAGGDEPRRRLLVVPDADRESAVERMRATGPLDGDHAAVIACNGTARSASADAGGRTGAPGPSVRRIDGSLADLGATITDRIEGFEIAGGELAPAELRVGMDHLPDHLSAYDTQEAFAFLHVFTRQVRRAGGMGHVRLPRDRDTAVVRTLAPLFDALLELRLEGHRLEQRWHLREHGIVSDWIDVPRASDVG
ncbi:MAG: hypothetical protein ABEJ81_07095 [Haloferacaceae archaeon]